MIASENRRGDNLHQIRVGQINQHDKISEIIPLLQESWPKMSKDYIKWKCSGSLFGIGAWDKQLIGFVGIQKRVLQCCTKKGVYPLLQNTCVQKKYRQKGVMTKMITFYANTNDKALADPNQIVLKILSNLRRDL